MLSSSMIRCNSKMDALRMFQAALGAVLPNKAVTSFLSKNSEVLQIGKTCYSLKSKQVSLVGFGKAVIRMAHAVQNILGEDLKAGILSVPLGTLETLNTTGKKCVCVYIYIPQYSFITKIEYNRSIHKSYLLHFILQYQAYLSPLFSSFSISKEQKIKIYEGAKNNLPDKEAFMAADEILKFVKSLNENDLLLVLISGGGSALLPVPTPPITLEEKCHITKLLASSGADIRELNIVRKALSAVKGGKLALVASPAKVVSLILSDVIGDELGSIASGPTIPPCSNSDDAMAIISKYNLIDSLPSSILNVLESNKSAYLLEMDTSLNSYEHVENYLIGSNTMALQAAKDTAERMNYAVCQLSTEICGEAKCFAQLVAQIARFMVDTFHGNASELLSEEIKAGFCKHGIHAEKMKELQILAQTRNRIAVLSGGETVVKVIGDGCGGRNQETALACSLQLQHTFKSDKTSDKIGITFLSAGTDGQDGPTIAAGAFAYLGQLDDMSDEKCRLQSFLSNNDSNNFFKQFRPDDLIVTGVTGTNVMDVHILLIVFDEQK